MPRLLHPVGHLRFVELVAFVDVEVAHFLVLGLAPGGTGRSDAPRKKATLMYFVKTWSAEEPALALDAVERRVPFHGLAHAGDGAHDERVEAAPDIAFPARHGRDVGLHGGVAVALRDLRVAARKQDRLRRRAVLAAAFFAAFADLVLAPCRHCPSYPVRRALRRLAA